MNFSKSSLPIIFLRDIYKNDLSVENANNKQSNPFKELSNTSKAEEPIKNNFFLEKVRILIEARENVLNSLKSNVFPIESSTPDPTPDPTHDPTLDPTLNPSVFYPPKQRTVRNRIPKVEISPFMLNRNFVNEIRNDEENKND